MLDLRTALPDDYQHLAVGDRPVKIKCPNSIHKARMGGREDKENSLAVYPHCIQCFGCKLHLGCGHSLDEPHGPRCDEFRLVALATLLGISPEQAAVIAGRYTSDSLDAYRERAAGEARRDPLPMALAEAYRDILWGPRYNQCSWLACRGLSAETLDEALIGHNGFQFTIPIFSADGALLTIRFRRDDEYGTKRPKYMGLPGRNGLYLYPENRLKEHWGDTLVVCEGELDALLLWQEGIPAVSATNGARQTHKVPGLLQGLGITHLIIATDQDEPGEEAARETKEAAEALGFTTERARWPYDSEKQTGFKDITEFYVSGGRL